MINQQSESADAPARRIVVVEDNTEMREMLAELLSVCGHEVQVAATGREALAVIAATAPDVALVDIGLPDLDGCEVARRIRSEAVGQGLQLVALTGHADEEDRRLAMDAGFDHFLIKPVEPAQLMAVLAR
ncbi:MAG TPA: response regulator [Pirellulales bacterium]|nr:response regulator [Pirellulales bacterium]